MLENMDGDFIIRYTESASMTYYQGVVISVEQAGKSVPKGSDIMIVVSDGPGPAEEEPGTEDDNIIE